MTLKILKHPLVYLSIILFLIHQIIERGGGFSIPIFHAYLDDLLCMPIILGLSTQIIQWIHPVKELYYLNKTAITIVVVFYSIIFEGILPFLNPSIYTADWIDVILYALGGFVFYQLISKKNKTQFECFLKELD
jgi:hypothetical protein